MKKFLPIVALFALMSCEDNTQKSDQEKVESETKIEIKTDTSDIKISEDGITVNGEKKDSLDIKINEKDGLKMEGKDGKLEIKTDEVSKFKIEKKGKTVNIQIKEN